MIEENGCPACNAKNTFLRTRKVLKELESKLWFFRVCDACGGSGSEWNHPQEVASEWSRFHRMADRWRGQVAKWGNFPPTATEVWHHLRARS